MRGIGCWFSDHSNCSHWSFEATVLPINPNIYTDQWEPIVLYHSNTLLVLIQLCSPRCWHLDSNYCHARCRQSQLKFLLSLLLLHLRTFQSDIPLFTLTNMDLYVFRCTKELCQRSFLSKGSFLWNDLPIFWKNLAHLMCLKATIVSSLDDISLSRHRYSYLLIYTLF